MTREEARQECLKIEAFAISEDMVEAMRIAQKALEQQPCEDAISRQAAIDAVVEWYGCEPRDIDDFKKILAKQLSVTPQPKTGHCKECKYFKYDSVVKVDGIPPIVVHEICSRWGDGCKTKEDGYCFLYEPQESEE